jgi:hypothetical protein
MQIKASRKGENQKERCNEKNERAAQQQERIAAQAKNSHSGVMKTKIWRLLEQLSLHTVTMTLNYCI